MHLLEVNVRKLDTKSIRLIFIGYSKGVMGYMLQLSSKHLYIYGLDVTLKEEKYGAHQHQESIPK